MDLGCKVSTFAFVRPKLSRTIIFFFLCFPPCWCLVLMRNALARTQHKNRMLHLYTHLSNVVCSAFVGIFFCFLCSPIRMVASRCISGCGDHITSTTIITFASFGHKKKYSIFLLFICDMYKSFTYIYENIAVKMKMMRRWVWRKAIEPARSCDAMCDGRAGGRSADDCSPNERRANWAEKKYCSQYTHTQIRGVERGDYYAGT